VHHLSTETRDVVRLTTGLIATIAALVLSLLISSAKSFALFAPRNGTAVVALFVCALSASCALMLILEMNSPFTGLMKISAVPMRDTLAHLGE